VPLCPQGKPGVEGEFDLRQARQPPAAFLKMKKFDIDALKRAYGG
jgi:hypothetical protein